MNASEIQRSSEAEPAGRRYWDRLARNYDRTGVVWGRPFPHMLDLVEVEVRGLSNVLEVAAGTGLVTSRISRVATHVVATDYSPAMLELLRTRVRREGLANVECLQRNIYDLGFAPHSFDAVVCANVLHLLPDLPGALASMRKVLKPGGVLVAPTFCHGQRLIARILSYLAVFTGFPVQRRFSGAALRGELEASGLVIRHDEMIDGLLPIAFLTAQFPPLNA